MARIKKIKIPVGSNELTSLDKVISVLNQYFDDIMSVHFQNATEEQVFINYYDGVQDIFLKKRKYKVDNEQPLSNNKIVENHAQAQVDFLTDYLMGEKPKFSSRNLDKLPVEKINTIEGFLVDSGFYTEQREVAKDMFKIGVGVSYQNIDTSIVEEYTDVKTGEKKYKYRENYQKMYDAPFEVTHLDPTMNFVVYSTNVNEEPLFGFNIVTLESPTIASEVTYTILGSYRLTIYTKEGAFVSNAEKRKENTTEKITYVALNVDKYHFTYFVRPLPMLPIVEKTYNKERMGIIETNKGLFDLINIIDSNGGDAIYDNVNQVFVFENVSIPEDKSLDDLIRSGAIQVSSTGAETTQGKVYTIEIKYNQADVNILKQEIKQSAYDIAGVPLASSNTSTGITGTAQKTGGGWENAEIKMNGRIVGMQKSDYSILKCLIEVCKIVLGDEFTNVNSSLIDITYKLSMNDNILSKCQSATNLYGIKMPLELILKITRLSNDPSSDAKKWQDRLDELDEKEFEKQLKTAKLESMKTQQQGGEEYAEQKRKEQEKSSEEKGINQKGAVDIKGDN